MDMWDQVTDELPQSLRNRAFSPKSQSLGGSALQGRPGLRPASNGSWKRKNTSRASRLSFEAFLPDVEKLQAQKEYLEAEESGDLERMRQIAIKFGSALSKMSLQPPPPYVTPATFETPEVHTSAGVLGGKPQSRGQGMEDGDGEAGEEKKEPLPSLDVFLSRYTSEINASFQEIMEPQAIESSQAGVETWKYRAKNSLMYYPEDVPDEEQLFKKPRQVVHKNTRFLTDPFSQALSRSQLQQSPLMTWGEVENTPLIVEASETPYMDRTPGPAFKILEPDHRERLGLKMANEATTKNRAKKQEAVRKVTENLASLTPKGLSPAMSPALQRLVSRTASKYTD
ncbi:hypothetical protein MC885_000082 [Smutsia gigantea]|nr:hypothetical protein MC885_000082 [Smutsia gigantea]